MIIGITGYIGVGKTTAANILAKYGFIILDVDKLGHELLKEDEIKNRLIAEFGEKILARDLEVDRKKLGELVFSNTELLQKLNSIIHNKLKIKLNELLIKEKSEKNNIIVDVALLTELEVNELCDKIILVKSDLENVYKRMVKGYSKRHIINVMNSQKFPKYDYMVENKRGELEKTVEKVAEIIKKESQ